MKQNRPLTTFRSALIAIAFLAPPASAVPYTVTNLGPIGQAYALRINDYGQVVGADNATERPVVWQPVSRNATTGAINLLPISPDPNGYATDINAMGQIAGYVASAAGLNAASTPFLFTPASSNSTSGTVVKLTSPSSGQHAVYAGINDFGEVCFNTGSTLHAAVFVPSAANQSSGTVSDLAPAFGQAITVNNVGQVIGSHQGYGSTYQMARFDPAEPRSATGTVILVSDPNQGGAAFIGPGAGFDVNVSGVIAGYGSFSLATANEKHAMLWYPGGQIKDVNVFTGMTDAYLFGINDHGIAVGLNLPVSKAFVFDANSNTFNYLETLVSDPAWSFREAHGINNFGQIVGMGIYNGTFTAFLLTPVQAGSGGRSSANYTISPETTDFGGRRTTSASFTNDGSIGTVAGISAVVSPAETAKAGYIGQLYEVTALALNAAPLTVNEGGTLQLAAWQLLNDATFLAVPAGSVAWSVANGPLTSINATGLATAGIVYQNTAASAQGIFAGNTGTLALTVLNVNKDDFGLYASDGIDDKWQVDYFGQNNPNAGPNVDFDGTGQTNLFKYIAGLDPRDPNSRFTTQIAPVPDPLHPGQFLAGQKNVIFSPRYPDRNYVVKFKLDLTDGTWNSLPSPPPTDNGEERTVTDSSATGAKKFYRIEIIKP